VNTLAKACCAPGIFLMQFCIYCKPWNIFVNILVELSCVSRIFFSIVLHLLPSHGQICEHSCWSLLCYNFVPKLS
jgi:hypothetical protein